MRTNPVGDAVDATAAVSGLLLDCVEGGADFWSRLDPLMDAVGLAAVACERSAARLRRDGDWTEAGLLETAAGRIRAVMAAILIHLGPIGEADGPCPILETAVRSGLVESTGAASLVDVAWWSLEARNLLGRGAAGPAAVALRGLAEAMAAAGLPGKREMVALLHGVLLHETCQPWHADACERILARALGIDDDVIVRLERGCAA